MNCIHPQFRKLNEITKTKYFDYFDYFGKTIEIV